MIAGVDDPRLKECLEKYHREKLTNNQLIAERLEKDLGIRLRYYLHFFVCLTFTKPLHSAGTVKRRRQALQLKGSGATRKEMPPEQAKQLVLDQMVEDPVKRHGVRTIQQKLAFAHGVHLPRSVC